MTADPWLAPHPDDRGGSPFGWDDEDDETEPGSNPMSQTAPDSPSLLYGPEEALALQQRRRDSSGR